MSSLVQQQRVRGLPDPVALDITTGTAAEKRVGDPLRHTGRERVREDDDAEIVRRHELSPAWLMDPQARVARLRHSRRRDAILRGMMCRLAPLFTLLLLIVPRISAAQGYVPPFEGEYVARDFRFQSGETLPEVQVALPNARHVRGKDADGVAAQRRARPARDRWHGRAGS